MDKLKFDEVGELLDLNSSETFGSKAKKLLKRIVFPFVQIGFFATSSLLGLAFGEWDNNNPTTYPFQGITRSLALGSLAIVGINSGNILITAKSWKKLRFIKTHTILIVFVNILLSIVSFIFLYRFAETNTLCMSSTVRYNVYSEEEIYSK